MSLESELIQKIQIKNDSKAFESLVAMQWDSIYPFQGKNIDQDWFQEARILILKEARKWDLTSESSFRSHIRGILYLAFENFRNQKRKLKKYEQPGLEIIDNTIGTYDPTERDLDYKWIRNEFFRIAENMIANRELSELELKVISAEFFCGANRDEICEKYKISKAHNYCIYYKYRKNALLKFRKSQEILKLWTEAKEIFAHYRSLELTGV